MNRTKYMNSQVKLNLPDIDPNLTPLENLMSFNVDNVSIENYNGDKSIKFSGIAV